VKKILIATAVAGAALLAPMSAGARDYTDRCGVNPATQTLQEFAEWADNWQEYVSAEEVADYTELKAREQATYDACVAKEKAREATENAPIVAPEPPTTTKRSKYTYCDTIRANPPLRMFGTLDVYARHAGCRSALRVARADDNGLRPRRGWKRTVHVDFIDDQYGPCIDAPWDAGCTNQGEWHRHSTWRKGRGVVKLVGNLTSQDEWQQATR
jgi:hypothetical protein